MRGLLVRHWGMTDSTTRPTVPVPPPTEVAATLPAEAVRYDPENPPLAGSVQRVTEGD